MTRHTPGPWFSTVVGDRVYGPSHFHPQATKLGVKMQSEPTICFVHGYNGSEEARANARLIAAAPDMLKALKAIESCLAPEDNDHAAKKVRAAIAKAEGRAS